jgi:hypothetical protein
MQIVEACALSFMRILDLHPREVYYPLVTVLTAEAPQKDQDDPFNLIILSIVCVCSCICSVNILTIS